MEIQENLLNEIIGILNNEDRFLPGGLVYYSDILFNPHYALRLGHAMASMFSEMRPDVVMTSEVKGIPLALFTAHSMGIPLAVCRFRNRASDGSAVTVHYPTKNGEVRAMYMGTRHERQARSSVIDDFMKGGRRWRECAVANEFGARSGRTGIFLSSDPQKRP